jgi:hypothetical protein
VREGEGDAHRGDWLNDLVMVFKAEMPGWDRKAISTETSVAMGLEVVLHAGLERSRKCQSRVALERANDSSRSDRPDGHRGKFAR